MHICIPDTREVRPPSGSAYLLYNVHIDGLYHCSLRYKQLHHLHQALSKRFPSSGNPEGVQLPSFPPKKLLPLTQGQVEDRRQLLEKYLQNISQDKQISQSSLFNMYLLEAQRESSARLVDAQRHVHLDIELVNGAKIRLPIVSQDSVDSILTACCRSLGLADQYHAFFCLCLCGYDVLSDKLIIKRRLSFFEAPFITLQMAIQQQEQLQSVLMSSSGCCTTTTTTTNSRATSDIANHHYYRSNHDHNQQYHSLSNHNHPGQQLTTSSSTTNLNNNNNSSSNPCRCLSCSQVPQLVSGSLSPSSSSSSSSSAPPVASDIYGRRCTCCNGATANAGTSQQVPPTAHVGNKRSSRGSFVTHRILLRKSYWDPIYDSYILSDSQALNLMFIQTVYDMKHSLMFVDRATYQRLESLLASDSKLEYILLARTLKYYNYVHFEPCYSDYPRPRTKVMISIGSKELNMRVLKSSAAAQPRVNGHHQHSHHLIPASQANQQQNSSSSSSPAGHDTQDQEVLYCTSSLMPSRSGPQRQLVTKQDLIEEEYNFKVPLIRCWRLTSLETLNSNVVQVQTGGGRHQQHAATTTLAGGKRRSLSLFNSVLGSHSTSGARLSNNNNGHLTCSSQTSQGVGGTSLMATLMAHTGDTNGSITAATGQQSGQPTSSSSSTDSFLRFSSNTNQTQTTSNNHHHSTATGQHHHRHHQCDATTPPAAAAEHPIQLSQYELSFEYLIAKDTLKWITISSDQAIFISISLQGVVDELVSKREMGAMEVTVAGPVPGIIGNQTQVEQMGDHLRDLSLVAAAPTSRPIAISKSRRTSATTTIGHQRQLAESFTYLYRDGAQKNIKAKSQQQLIDRFCSGVGGGGRATTPSSLSSSAPPSASYVLAANTLAYASRQRNQSETATNSSAQVMVVASSTSPSSNSSSFISSAPSNNNNNNTRRSSILQVASLWGSSPPGRYYGHQSSSGNYAATNGNGGGVVPFEFGHHYHCNTRHACANGQGSGHTSKCKAPSPIINDAFEGVVGNDHDF